MPRTNGEHPLAQAVRQTTDYPHPTAGSLLDRAVALNAAPDSALVPDLSYDSASYPEFSPARPTAPLMRHWRV